MRMKERKKRGKEERKKEETSDFMCSKQYESDFYCVQLHFNGVSGHITEIGS